MWDFCDKETRNASEMKKYLKSHWYREAHYNMKNVIFFAESEFTMEVHLRKLHSEKYECGLCNFEAMNLEN